MRRPRVAGLAPAALAAAVALAGCSGAVQQAASSSSSTTTTTVVTNTKLTLGAAGPLPSCLPAGRHSSEAGDALAQMLLPSPFYVGPDGSVNPNLELLADGRAEVVNTEPFTVVYAINPEAQWSTGAPVRAGDFATAWRVRAISSLPEFAPYRLVGSVVASNAGRTVTVTFTEPYADWRSLFTQLIPKAQEPVPGFDACLPVDASLPSATPWRLSGSSPSSATLTFNPTWWGDRPPFSGVELRLASDQAQLATWAGEGSLDLVAASNPDAASIAAASTRRSHVRRLSLTGRLVDLELQTESGPTKDELLRRALVALLDRQAIVTATTASSSLQYTPAASHLFAPNVSAYPSGAYQSPTAVPGEAPTATSGALASPRAQPELAAKLLAKAGYRRVGATWANEDGRGLTLTLAVPTSAPLAGIGQLLALQLTGAGIPTAIVPAGSSEAAGLLLEAGEVDGAVLLRSLTPFPTQTGAWYSSTTGDHGELNYSRFADPEVDVLLAKASQELNPVYAIEDYRSVDELLWSRAPTLPLLWLPQLWSARADLLGPEDPTLGFDASSLLNWRRTTTQPQATASSQP